MSAIENIRKGGKIKEIPVNGKKIIEYDKYYELVINEKPKVLFAKPISDAIFIFGLKDSKFLIGSVFYPKHKYKLEDVMDKAKKSDMCSLCKGVEVKFNREKFTKTITRGKKMALKDIFEFNPEYMIGGVIAPLLGGAVDRFVIKPHLEKAPKLLDKINVLALAQAVAGVVLMSFGLALLLKERTKTLEGLLVWTFGSALVTDGLEHLLGWNPGVEYRIVGYYKPSEKRVYEIGKTTEKEEEKLYRFTI